MLLVLPLIITASVFSLNVFSYSGWGALTDIFIDLLAKIGINTTNSIVNTISDLEENRDQYDIILVPFTQIGGLDPSDTLSIFISENPLNFGNYENEVVDHYFQLANTSPIKNEMKIYFEELEKLLLEDAPSVNILNWKLGHNIARSVSDVVKISHDSKFEFPNIDNLITFGNKIVEPVDDIYYYEVMVGNNLITSTNINWKN